MCVHLPVDTVPVPALVAFAAAVGAELVGDPDELPGGRFRGAARGLVVVPAGPAVAAWTGRLPRGTRLLVFFASSPSAAFVVPSGFVLVGPRPRRRRVAGRLLVLRPAAPSSATSDRPSLSIVVPARNERGNIAPLLARLPPFPGVDVEVLFVEGHSTDATYEELERACREWPGRHALRLLRQPGIGKADAVRYALDRATKDLVTILDADLSVPPELLPRFYERWREDAGDFVNGNRFSVEMEPGAMRPLNRLGNRVFARALRARLAVPIGDALCGTKLFARADYQRMRRWREDFDPAGELDPFGDFEFLFAAATLGLGIVEVEVDYRARRYGSTQIRRFRDGWRLFRMLLRGADLAVGRVVPGDRPRQPEVR